MTLGEEQIPFVIHFDEEKGVRFRFLMGKVFLFQKLRRTILRRSFFDDVPDLIVGECSFEKGKLNVRVDKKDGVFFKGRVLEFSGILFP